MSLDSRLERILAGKPAALLDAVASTRVLMHTAALLEQRMDCVLAPLGLHMREYLALFLLADSIHEAISPSSLSISLNATRTQVTRLLDSLEAKGLMLRVDNQTDRRGLELQLTDAGAQLLAQAIPLIEAVHQQTWAPLGDKHTHAMHLHLRKVHDGLLDANALTNRQKLAAGARPASTAPSKIIARTDDPATP